MQEVDRSETTLATTGCSFNSTTAAICGLFLATHSIVVTLIGTAAATLLTGWALWLSYYDDLAVPEKPDPQH